MIWQFNFVFDLNLDTSFGPRLSLGKWQKLNTTSWFMKVKTFLRNHYVMQSLFEKRCNSDLKNKI